MTPAQDPAAILWRRLNWLPLAHHFPSLARASMAAYLPSAAQPSASYFSGSCDLTDLLPERCLSVPVRFQRLWFRSRGFRGSWLAGVGFHAPTFSECRLSRVTPLTRFSRAALTTDGKCSGGMLLRCFQRRTVPGLCPVASANFAEPPNAAMRSCAVSMRHCLPRFETWGKRINFAA